MAIDSKNVKTAYPNGTGASTSYGPAVGEGSNTPAFRPMSHVKRQVAMQLRPGTLTADFQNAMLHAFPAGTFITDVYAYSAPGTSGVATLSVEDVNGNTSAFPVLTTLPNQWVAERDLDKSITSRSQITGTVTGEVTVVIAFLQTVEDGAHNGLLAQPGEYPVFGGPEA